MDKKLRVKGNDEEWQILCRKVITFWKISGF